VSLVARPAENHPQQVAKRGRSVYVDDRETTPEVFDPLHERFGFTIDVAASADNAKLPRYYTAEDDGLARTWAHERVWCNPPYCRGSTSSSCPAGCASWPPAEDEIKPNQRPPFGCCLLIWGLP
jgi:phage N-6-adenine-methyltransferase